MAEEGRAGGGHGGLGPNGQRKLKLNISTFSYGQRRDSTTPWNRVTAEMS